MMKCGTCGYVDHAESRMCKGCGRITPHSVLIPFPIAASVAQNLEPASPPPWKIELQERINAIRARRKIITAIHQAAEHPVYPPHLGETSQAKQVHPAIKAVYKRFRHYGHHQPTDDSTTLPVTGPSAGHASLQADCSADGSNGSFMSGSPQDGKPPMAIDSAAQTVQKKSRAAAPTPEHSADAVTAGPSSLQDALQRATAWSEPDLDQMDTSIESWIERMDQQARCCFSDDSPAEIDSSSENDHEFILESPVELQASKPASATTAQAGEFPLQPASMSQRAVASLIDLGVMVMANVPFLAMSEFSRANFSDVRVLCIHGVIALILYFLYMSLMLMTMGQTIGMHKVGIVAVDAVSLNQPSLKQAIRRACGLMVAPIVCGLRFISAASDMQGRSFSDMVSHTTVHQTYEELPVVQASWLYHHCRP